MSVEGYFLLVQRLSRIRHCRNSHPTLVLALRKEYVSYRTQVFGHYMRLIHRNSNKDMT
jgi:hypothetical protein